jgi:hypothetical protein
MSDLPTAYLRALTVLCEVLPIDEINWALTGSVGHRLQGVVVDVHDIDVQTDEASTGEAAQRLAAYLVDAPVVRESERMWSLFATLRIEGIQVELMGGIRKRPGPGQPWGPPTDPADHRVLLTVAGLRVPVLSLSYEAAAYEQIGRPERAAQLRSALARVTGE